MLLLDLRKTVHGFAVSFRLILLIYFYLFKFFFFCISSTDGTPYFKVIQELNKIDGKDLKLNEQVNNMNDIVSTLRQHAYRGDLRESDDAIPYGNTDIKTYSSKNHKFTIQSGPIYTSIPSDIIKDESAQKLTASDVFEWEKFSDVSHDEHPEAWNFPAVHVQYIWN